MPLLQSVVIGNALVMIITVHTIERIELDISAVVVGWGSNVGAPIEFPA
jgi:hypothetical protein